MPKVIICGYTNQHDKIADLYDSSTYESYDCSNAAEFIKDYFNDVLPKTVKIYENCPSVETEITPTNEKDVKRLAESTGIIWVLVYPAGPLLIPALVVTAVVVTAVVLSSIPSPSFSTPSPSFSTPSTPELPPSVSGYTAPAQSGNSQTSIGSNNSLSSRTNSAAYGNRQPSIWGQERSIPDLIQVPYTFYKDNRAFEVSYMFISEGEGLIDDVKDGITPLSEISGAQASFYAPYTSPNSGSPYFKIGGDIDPDISVVQTSRKYTTVNGQELLSPDFKRFSSVGRILINGDGDVITTDNSVDFTETFESGQDVNLKGAILNFDLPTNPVENAKVKFDTGNTILFFDDLESPTTHTLSVGDVFNVFVSIGSSFNGDYIVETSSVNSITVRYSGWSNILTQTSFFDATYQIAGGGQFITLDERYPLTSVIEDTFTVNPNFIEDVNFALIKMHGGNIPVSTMIDDDQGQSITSTFVSFVTSEAFDGEFRIEYKSTTKILLNVVATRGLYRTDGKSQRTFDIDYQYILTHYDGNDNQIGQQTHDFTILGSSILKSERAKSDFITPAFPDVDGGYVTISARRITPSDFDYNGNVVDELKWRDLITLDVVDKTDFGDCTTVLTVTEATEGALAVKSRELNLLFTRSIYTYENGIQSVKKTPTKNVAHIFNAIALDKNIGRRTLAEVDTQQIIDEVEAARDYFGTDQAIEFGYTLDNDQVSFEEIAQIVGGAAFGRFFRLGNKLQFRFERPSENSRILFNHRNKVPNSESRDIRLGSINKFDGVEYKYRDQNDGSEITLYMPADKSATRPEKVFGAGVRNEMQATAHMMRVYNRQLYSNENLEFSACSEADLLIPGDRIICTDMTSESPHEGDIRDQDGLVVTLSQPIKMESGVNYTMFLQMYDATVDSVKIQAGSHDREVVMLTPPKLPLVTDRRKYAQTTYQIVSDQEGQDFSSFIVSERTPNSDKTSSLVAENYDARYYQNDHDFING